MARPIEVTGSTRSIRELPCCQCAIVRRDTGCHACRSGGSFVSYGCQTGKKCSLTSFEVNGMCVGCLVLLGVVFDHQRDLELV